MNFVKHSDLVGQHATFSPSQSSWLRYPDEKIVSKIVNLYRNQIGTEIHDFAAAKIELRRKVSSARNLIGDIETWIYCKYKYMGPEFQVGNLGYELIDNLHYLPSYIFDTIKCYINDGVVFRMTPEQPLFYSKNIFGTADTISFQNDILRIHDLKTGEIPADMEQLEVYAALFCLEYKKDPKDISIELRIYQGNEVIIHNPEANDISNIIKVIVNAENVVNKIEKDE